MHSMIWDKSISNSWRSVRPALSRRSEGIEELLLKRQDGFRSIQKRFKVLSSAYWTSLLCVSVTYRSQSFFLKYVWRKTFTCVSSGIGFKSSCGLQIAPLGLPRSLQSCFKRFKALSNTYKISHPCAFCDRLLSNADVWASIKRSFPVGTAKVVFSCSTSIKNACTSMPL